MPSRLSSSTTTTKDKCSKCKQNQGNLTVRSAVLCNGCFENYIHTKVVKRLEGFRVRFENNNNNNNKDEQRSRRRKLLLPLSFGISSLTLLHVLDAHLKRQKERNGRTGFEISVVFVDDGLSRGTGDGQDRDDLVGGKFEVVKGFFSDYSFSCLSLSSFFTPSRDSLTSYGSIQDISTEQESVAFEKLVTFISLIPTNTSRADVITLLRLRLIVRFAKEQGFEGIFWGDSTTKLAEKILGETAKGRGFSLGWQVADGESPYGMSFYYPMRDLLKKELFTFADLTSPPLTDMVDPRDLEPTLAPPSSRNTTIDSLMKQYFESVEESYPSIVSNVVRTTGKLQAPIDPGAGVCRMCQLHITDELRGIHGWGGDQAEAAAPTAQRGQLCSGCARSVPVEAVELLPPV